MKEDVRALGPDFALTGPPLIFEEIRSSIVRESALATSSPSRRTGSSWDSTSVACAMRRW